MPNMDCRTQLASMAIEEMDNGVYCEATRLLTTSIRLDPNNHELYYDRSICHYKLGDCKASFDDAEKAIRLKPDDYVIHYQKGLAACGLLLIDEAIVAFKKAIELRARQPESKLSDILDLLRGSSLEWQAARIRKRGNLNQANGSIETGPVDSTTDQPQNQSRPSSTHQSVTTFDELMKNGSSNLVAPSRNTQPLNGGIGRVSSSASHLNGHNTLALDTSTDSSSANHVASNFVHDMMGDSSSSQHLDQSKASAYDWNIRRSERIFLHTSETGSPVPQFNIQPRPLHEPTNNVSQKAGSNPSSINSVKINGKRPHDSNDPRTFQQNILNKSNGESESHTGSDVDVDDSYNSPSTATPAKMDELLDHRKRLIIAPSSSMPATSQGPSTSASKDDSYSSKYKRLRRDRERARRGTSKLCTIKPSDLEDLQKSPDSGKRFMRVIAPIDGWLYSGQLSIDEATSGTQNPLFVVKLEGDASGSTYLFSQLTVLNDVIKEVRVKSVSDLRKGARICCYYKRQYKCLSTGVVTSRTFEATKSLVSVKYDNGSLSALPLEDLRLLPPDYPKYMSNCDPLLLAQDGEEVRIEPTCSVDINQQESRFNLDTTKPPIEAHQPSIEIDSAPSNEEPSDVKVEARLAYRVTIDNTSPNQPNGLLENQADYARDIGEVVADKAEDDEEARIPPTDETIEFITSDSDSTLKEQDDNHHSQKELVDRIILTKDTLPVTNETQLKTNPSHISLEENNYGIEYRPWVFEGPPKGRSKKSGRTYRVYYSMIRRGEEIIKVGDSAELMPRDESILPFIGKIDGLWSTSRGEMRVKVRWYYRLVETGGAPYELKDGQHALFETGHEDENDVQSICRAIKILSWKEYSKYHLGDNDFQRTPRIFYLAGHYNPVQQTKHLRPDVKEAIFGNVGR